MPEKTWIERVNQVMVPIAIVGVGGYGAWDLIIRPWSKQAPIAEACATTIAGVYIEIPGKAGRPAKQIKMSGELPAVVPAGEKRQIQVKVDNPDDKAVVYTWRATYGTFASTVTTDGESTYVAPANLVDDSLFVEVRRQGCTVATQTAKVAVTLSATTPTEPLPIAPSDPAPSPNQ
jgi:hypothetical protein